MTDIISRAGPVDKILVNANAGSVHGHSRREAALSDAPDRSPLVSLLELPSLPFGGLASERARVTT